jgi:hypothetical protein
VVNEYRESKSGCNQTLRTGYCLVDRREAANAATARPFSSYAVGANAGQPITPPAADDSTEQLDELDACNSAIPHSEWCQRNDRERTLIRELRDLLRMGWRDRQYGVKIYL